jgi:short-subunit dehydrogenase
MPSKGTTIMSTLALVTGASSGIGHAYAVRLAADAPTMLMRAEVSGMQERGSGTIVNVTGMIAFSGPGPSSHFARRAVDAGTPAHLVAMSQTLSAELATRYRAA